MGPQARLVCYAVVVGNSFSKSRSRGRSRIKGTVLEGDVSLLMLTLVCRVREQMSLQ